MVNNVVQQFPPNVPEINKFDIDKLSP